MNKNFLHVIYKDFLRNQENGSEWGKETLYIRATKS